MAGMPEAPTSLNPTLCPLCGQPNQCALEIERASGLAQPPCWCSKLSFEEATLQRIPAAAKGKACVCLLCASGPAASSAQR
jgi:hypothetical protein